MIIKLYFPNRFIFIEIDFDFLLNFRSSHCRKKNSELFTCFRRKKTSEIFLAEERPCASMTFVETFDVQFAVKLIDIFIALIPRVKLNEKERERDGKVEISRGVPLTALVQDRIMKLGQCKKVQEDARFECSKPFRRAHSLISSYLPVFLYLLRSPFFLTSCRSFSLPLPLTLFRSLSMNLFFCP